MPINLPSPVEPIATSDGRITTTWYQRFVELFRIVSLPSTYTPTLTNTTNVAASTAFTARYSRYGDHVTVYGTVNIDPTAAAPTATVMKISLPIASGFTDSVQLAGVAIDGPSSQAGALSADTTDDVASLSFQATSTAVATWRYTFNYQVL